MVVEDRQPANLPLIYHISPILATGLPGGVPQWKAPQEGDHGQKNQVYSPQFEKRDAG